MRRRFASFKCNNGARVSDGLTATSNAHEAVVSSVLDGPAARTESIDTALSKAEKRKLYSGHLREPLQSELLNDDIRFSEDAVQPVSYTHLRAHET